MKKGAQGLWPVKPRVRVISDNDYAGDPDGLVQLAHHLLCENVDLRCVIGSHLRPGDPFNPEGNTAAMAAVVARKLAAICGRPELQVIAGSAEPMKSETEAVESDAVDAIIEEAMRDDSDLPLFVVCGGGLTGIASAWLKRPEISKRLTLIWIGGHEHEGLAVPPPGGTDMEYNLNIDPAAGRVVFNESDLNIWQVPRDAYRQLLVSRAELILRLYPYGELGRYLYETLAGVADTAQKHGFNMGENYIMGDSPLVLLTALTSAFEPAPSSCRFVTMPCPRIADNGLYESNPDGRSLKVFTSIDTRLVIEDFFSKIRIYGERL